MIAFQASLIIFLNGYLDAPELHLGDVAAYGVRQILDKSTMKPPMVAAAVRKVIA